MDDESISLIDLRRRPTDSRNPLRARGASALAAYGDPPVHRAIRSTLEGTPRRLALIGSIATAAVAMFALAAPVPARAATLGVSVSPTQPSYADKYTVNYTFDANDFATDVAGTRYAWVRIILIPADGLTGCAPTEAGSAEYAYRGGYDGGFEPASFLVSDLYFGDSERPLRGTFMTVNQSRIPQGNYILCGYLYDLVSNPEVPDPAQGREHGGVPDVGPVAHAFTVRPARSTVSLSVAENSVGADGHVTLTAPWSGEAGYATSANFWTTPVLDVFMFPDRGQACPTDVPNELGASAFPLASEDVMFESASRDAADPDRIDRGTARMRGFIDQDQPQGRYLLCAYMSRSFTTQAEESDAFKKADLVTTVFTEARSSPVPLRITNGTLRISCAKAKKQLNRAKGMRAKAKRKRANAKAQKRVASTKKSKQKAQKKFRKAKKKVKKAKGKVKKAKQKVKAAC